MLTGGNRNDITQLLPLLDAVPPVRGKVGRPRATPRSASTPTAATTTTAIDARCAGEESGHRSPAAGPHTAPDWAAIAHVVERSFAWLHGLKRLLVRYERRADMHEAFLALACCLICFRQLRAAS